MLVDLGTGMMSGGKAAFLLDAMLEDDQEDDAADNQDRYNGDRDHIGALALAVIWAGRMHGRKCRRNTVNCNGASRRNGIVMTDRSPRAYSVGEPGEDIPDAVAVCGSGSGFGWSSGCPGGAAR